MSNPKIEQYQQDLVDQLIIQMESSPQWAKEWSDIPFAPYNGSSGNLYSGINQINLSMDLVATKGADPRFFTFNQIRSENLKLKQGAEGLKIKFYMPVKKELEGTDNKIEEVYIPFIRLSTVFRASDIEGLEPYEKTEGFKALKDDRDLTTKLNEVIKNAGVNISHGGNRAFYSPADDSIMMPPPERFSSYQAYAATLLHELSHSTGHKTRQNRDFSTKQGSYPKEELRAELSSIFMCQKLGISHQLENDNEHSKNSAAYLKSWIKDLKNDKGELFKAAADANKITAFLVDGKSFERVLNKANTNQAMTISNQQANSPTNKDFNNAVDLVWSGKFENMQALKKGLSNPASIALDAPLENIIEQSASSIKKNLILLGGTPKVLKEIGIPSLPLTMNYSKLFEIKKDHNVAPKALKGILKEVDSPAMIFKNKNNRPNSFVLLTETTDTKNKPIIVTLHVDRRQGTMSVNRIASIYGRNISQIRSALKRNELVYAHKQKSQLIMSRLQLPSSLLTDSVGIITNENIKSSKLKPQSLIQHRSEPKGRAR